MGIFDPQGIPSSPTTQTNTNTNTGIAAWAQPYVTNYLNKGTELINQGPNAAQQQVYNAAQNLQTPGQFAQGSNYANQAGAGLLGTTGTALGYGAQGAGYGQQATQAGQNYANMATDPSQIQAYMSPYIQQSLAPQLQMLNQQQAIAGQGINAKAVGQGAFGGNRATLAQGLNAQNYDLARQQAIGQGYDTAFKNAQQAQQFGSTLGLQGLQTGIQGAQAGLQGVQGAQQGYQGATQAGSALGNIGSQQSQADVSQLGLQNTIANQQYNLPYQQLNFMQGLMQGLPMTTTSASTQGYQAAPNKLAQTVGALGTLGSYAPGMVGAGTDLYKYLSGLKGGPGIPGITTGTAGIGDQGASSPTMPNGSVNPNYDAYANPNATAADIAAQNATALQNIPSVTYSQEIASGGQITGNGVKRYASGGIASINREVINDPTAYSEDTVNRGAQDNVLGGVTKLLALDTIAKQNQAMQNQQAMQQQAKPPVLAQLQQQAMPQQMPQQMAQAMPPQGIDAAQSNLPQQYAGGGIIAFQAGGEPPKSAFSEDIGNLWNSIKEGYSDLNKNLTRPQWLEGIRGYLTRPNQKTYSPGDAESQPGYMGPGQAPDAVPVPSSNIVIHPNAPRVAGPAAAPAAPESPVYRPAETSGIDALRTKYEDMIKGSEDFGQAQKDAERNAFRKTMLGLMATKNPYALGAAGEAGLAGQESLEKSMETIQGRKDKQIGQLVALGLKGEDLKNEAKKLGISETELKAKLPLYSSEVVKNLATAKYIGSGKGGAGSKIAAGTLYKIQQEYKAYKADPKSAPFFNQLPKNVKDGLTKYPPDSTSYNNALKEFNRIADQERDSEIGVLRALGAGSNPSVE